MVAETFSVCSHLRSLLEYTGHLTLQRLRFQPELDIHGLDSTVYLGALLSADTGLIRIFTSVQWLWRTNKSAFIQSCKNPTLPFLQTAAFQLK